jgi:hypothetical protein
MNMTGDYVKTNPTFKLNGEGPAHDPMVVLISVAGIVYQGFAMTTPEGSRKANVFLDEMLAAAFRGGFRQGDILRTLLSRNDQSSRTLVMAEAACLAAGDKAIQEIFDNAEL